MNKKHLIKEELGEAAGILDKFLSDKKNILSIEKAAQLLVECIKNGGKILTCGNGGSHCDAMHFAEELTGRYRNDRNPIPAIAISDSSHITCVANDYGYDFVFSRYIEALAKENDVLVGISTSGNSKNIINAINAAKINGTKIIILTGNGGGKMSNMADVEIMIPHFGYADRIQEMHIKIIHILILLIEKSL